MGSWRHSALVLVVLLAACTPAAKEPSSTTSLMPTTMADSTGFGCVSAPDIERHSASPFALSISDNPVHPGETVFLNLGSTVFEEQNSSSNPIDRGVTGYGSTWQCWNGEDWVDTHLLVHGGETIAGQPDVTTTVPAIGLSIPNSYSIVVPEVPSGWYRIEARTVGPEPYGAENFERRGYIAIEVIE